MILGLFPDPEFSLFHLMCNLSVLGLNYSEIPGGLITEAVLGLKVDSYGLKL